MSELLTSAQMRAVEQAAINTGAVTGLELMERAGLGVVEAIFEEWPELDRRGASPSRSPEDFGQEEGDLRAVVLCGPGNNGGDGFVVARLLQEKGWSVEVFLFGDAKKLPPDAKANYARWRDLGKVLSWNDYEQRSGWGCDVLVDALFGTGLARGLPDLGDLFWNMKDMVDCFEVEPGHPMGRPAIVAVDIPSGVCADSGRAIAHDGVDKIFSASAHLTVTFHKVKPGHFLDQGPARCGKVVIKGIGLSEDASWRSENFETLINLTGPADPTLLAKFSDDHKYAHGHSLILSGASAKGGAARLAARGSLRIGAGLVTIGCPPEALAQNAARLDAVMLAPVHDRAAIREVLKDTRINTLCLGPGLGYERARDLLPEALAARRPTVLDADALSAFGDAPAELFEMLHADCVLTPHGGEFFRLFPDIAERLVAKATSGPAFSKVDAVRAAAERAGCVVLYKGPDTVIADQTGGCSIHSAQYERAAPWLATAGAGDVLSGFIAGLLARGFAPMQAATTAAWLHVECALSFGPGLIAEDLPECLPKLFAEMGL